MTTKADKLRLIAPGSTLLRCVDGVWADRDGITPTGELIAIATVRGLQCWKNKELLDEIVERPGEELSDVDDLNGQIPKQDWELGLDGKSRPPWQLCYAAYLIDIPTATRYTFVNSTTGARIAVEKLQDRMLCMAALRHAKVRPIVQLDSRPMQTAFGKKLRPEFTITDWRDLSGEGGALLGIHRGGGGGPPLLEHKTEAAPAPEKKKKTAAVGKPVKPVSVSEELNDALPDDLAPPVTDNILGAD
jgi:hypothetical protein